jgi:hypothetical protein
MGYKMEDQSHQIDEEIGCRVSKLGRSLLGRSPNLERERQLGHERIYQNSFMPIVAYNEKLF